jgi:ASC-1-like (ASCH) protein
MLEREGTKNVLPDKNSIEEAIKIYRKFYKKSEEKEFGVLAIKIKK